MFHPSENNPYWKHTGTVVVFLHIRTREGKEAPGGMRLFSRVPAVGEYIVADIESPYYEVKVVVHTAQATDPDDYIAFEYDADVYAVETDVDYVTILRPVLGLGH